MKAIMYYNPKNNKYQRSEVISVNDDIVNCFNKKANFYYTESIKRLIMLSNAENPDWHGENKKPLIKIIK